MTKKKNKKIDGGFLLVEWELWDSKPFRELTPHARNLYCEFKRRYNGINANNLKLSQTEVKAKNIMAVNTFINARNQLIEKGFIDVIRRGGLEKQSAIFRLSYRWKKYGTPEFEKRNINEIFPPIFKTVFKKGHKINRKLDRT